MTCLGSPHGREPHFARPLNFGPISRQHLALGLRSGLYALAFLLGGALLLIFIGLCTIVGLADYHCDLRFGYYGCGTPGEAGSLNALWSPQTP